MNASLGLAEDRLSRVTSFRLLSPIYQGRPDTGNACSSGNSHQRTHYAMPAALSFEETFLPHLDAAYNLARWILGRNVDAEDVVQEAYIRAWKGYPKFRGENPRAWLLTIVRNTALTWRKRYYKGEKIVPLDEESCAIPRRRPLATLDTNDRNFIPKHGFCALV